jgi:YggT family protein
MNGGLWVLLRFILLMLDVISLAMLGRAVLSWFTMGEQTKIGAFLYVVTEPVILPIRNLCARFGWFQGLPMDMPFLISMVLMTLISTVIQASL